MAESIKYARKQREFEARALEYEKTKNPLLVLDTVVEAVRYELPLPEWALRAQAKINEAMLRAGRKWHTEKPRRRGDLASVICRAAGLVKTGRGTPFSQEAAQSRLFFLGYVMEQWRLENRNKKGRLPSLVDTEREFLDVDTEDLSFRQLRRARAYYARIRKRSS